MTEGQQGFQCTRDRDISYQVAILIIDEAVSGLNVAEQNCVNQGSITHAHETYLMYQHWHAIYFVTETSNL